MLTLFLIALAVMLVSGIVLIGGIAIKIGAVIILIAIVKKIWSIVTKKGDGLS